jgi:aryl-alcohol dehydrogenase-like predicted oxidoreductase
MPPGRSSLSASDAYRFVLSNPLVDVCMVGARNRKEMKEDLKTLELGPLDQEEMENIRAIGDFVYGRKPV